MEENQQQPSVQEQVHKVDTTGMSESDAIRAKINSGELKVGTIYEEPDPTPDPDHMVLRTDKLVKIYGSRKVVDGPSIMVRQGEIVGLLGPNGAGKTTTFYMTVGLIPVSYTHLTLPTKA